MLPDKELPKHIGGFYTLLTIMIGAYLIVTLCVISSCFATPHGCGAFNALIPNFDISPLVHRPVAFLEAQGNFARAELVRDVYSFTWSFALLYVALFIGLTAIWLRRLTPSDIEQLALFYEDRAHVQDQTMLRKGSLLFRALAAVLLLWLIWGHFDFKGHGTANALSNAVHVRNRDLYTPAIVWSMLMLFGLLLVGVALRRYVLRKRAVSPCG
jgi:hypothetical protein